VWWGHHRWLVFITGPERIEFLFKHHVINRPGSHLPAAAAAVMTPQERVQTLWWEGGFEASERYLWTAEELDGFLESFAAGAGARRTWRRRLRR
jgi:hypothetical protein